MMYKTFVSLLMVGAAMATPLAREYPCIEASLSQPEWKLQDFSYNMTYKDPIQQQPLHNMTTTDLRFTIVNPAYEYKITCTGTSYQDDKHIFVNEIHGCERPENSVWNDWTTFTYDEKMKLHVAQTWTCKGTNPNGQGSRFTAQSTFGTGVGCSVSDEMTEDKDGNQFRSGRFAQCSMDDKTSKVTGFKRMN